MEFPRQEYWSREPFPSPGDLPNSGIELAFPTLVGGFCTTEPPGKSPFCLYFALGSHPLSPLVHDMVDGADPSHGWRLIPKPVSHSLSATRAASGTSHEAESPQDAVRPFLGSWTHIGAVFLESWEEKADGMGIMHPLGGWMWSHSQGRSAEEWGMRNWSLMTLFEPWIKLCEAGLLHCTMNKWSFLA